MNNSSRLIMLGGLIPLLLLLVIPHVNAESNARRASDGFSNGSDAARTDVNFNPACDPTGKYTSDGQHTSTYCNAWTDGYTSTWNSIHQVSQSQTQSQQQSQSQQVHTCIALKCVITQGNQGQDQQSNQGNTQP